MTMRIVFIGNSEGWSEHFAMQLADRMLARPNETQLVAIVSPIRWSNRTYVSRFRAKRTLSTVMDRVLGQRLKARIIGARATGLIETFHRLSVERGLPLLWARDPSADETIRFVEAVSPDLCIVAGLNRILKQPLLERLPDVVNIHPSLLPAYRGGSPEFWQLANGERQGGVTIHRIDAGVDTGPILLQDTFRLEPWHDKHDIARLARATATSLLDQFLDGYPDSLRHGHPQVGPGSHQPMPTASDRVIGASLGVDGIIDRARAFGWDVPLVAYVARADWESGGGPLVESNGGDVIALHLSFPMRFDLADRSTTDDLPLNELRRTERGAVMRCGDRTAVYFPAVTTAP